MKKITKKFYKNCNLKTSSTPFCVCKIKHNLYWKIEFLKPVTDIRYVILIQLCGVLHIPFHRRFFKTKNGPRTSFQATSLTEFLNINFSFIILNV